MWFSATPRRCIKPGGMMGRRGFITLKIGFEDYLLVVLLIFSFCRHLRHTRDEYVDITNDNTYISETATGYRVWVPRGGCRPSACAAGGTITALTFSRMESFCANLSPG